MAHPGGLVNQPECFVPRPDRVEQDRTGKCGMLLRHSRNKDRRESVEIKCSSKRLKHPQMLNRIAGNDGAKKLSD